MKIKKKKNEKKEKITAKVQVKENTMRIINRLLAKQCDPFGNKAPSYDIKIPVRTASSNQQNVDVGLPKRNVKLQ